jgi:hypothetical protein
MTDLGPSYPVDSAPTYNIKNNPSVFNFKGNNLNKLNYLRQVLLAISFNQDFLLIALDLKNMGRSYYNQNPKRFCSTLRLGAVDGFAGKQITVYLRSPGGNISNSINYVQYNYTTKTPLLRVLEKQKLPACWSNEVLGGTGKCKQIATTPAQAPLKLTPNEQVLYYYIKNADFFTRMLKLLVSSFYDHSVQRFQCYTLPEDLYAGTPAERTYTVTGDYLRAIYSTFLRYQRLGSTIKLPQPINLNVNYNIDTTFNNLDKKEMIKDMNDDSLSFPI